MKYKKAALGGTFDRFHTGHELLLRTGLAVADQLVIGITKPELTTGKILRQLIEPYEVRVNNVQHALTQLGADQRATLIPLDDIYGPTVSDPSIDVLVLSSQTKSGGNQINVKRKENNLAPLPIIETEMIKNDAGEHLSSTQVREGFVTRSGRAYGHLFHHDIVFSKSTLDQFSRPQGELLSPESITSELLHTCTTTWLVGDTVTHYFLDQNLPFDGAIIDGKTRRDQAIPLPPKTIMIDEVNPPGIISASVVTAINSFRATQPTPLIMKVEGEEDLLGFIPCLLEPLNSAVFYGQPDKGVVMIRLTEAVKLRLARSLDPQFS